jgi:hypothetical protein
MVLQNISQFSTIVKRISSRKLLALNGAQSNTGINDTVHMLTESVIP